MDRRELLRIAGLAAAAGAVPSALLGGRAWASPAIGAAAPAFSRPDAAGGTVSLDGLRGKVVVLEWTNHDCPFVRKHYGGDNMQALQREAAAQGVAWLTIASSPPGEQGHVGPTEANALTERRRAAPAGVLLDHDGTMARAYGARVTPHMYVIDAEGILRYMGAIDDKPSTSPETLKTATSYVRPAVAAVLAGRAPEPAVTRAYGCTIKLAAPA
ncbi:MAG: thioredoxin family protein [Alphaproteobacteria bacterium]|nr:thioredoxin family protein [Alphaproteobacteria bacterium]